LVIFSAVLNLQNQQERLASSVTETNFATRFGTRQRRFSPYGMTFGNFYLTDPWTCSLCCLWWRQNRM